MKHFLLFFSILLFSLKASTQTFVFGQLTGSPVLNTQGWNLNGNAYVGSYMHLLSAGRAGKYDERIWYPSK